MTVYTRAIATAQRMIRKWGLQVTLTRTTPGAYDPATGSTGAASTATYSGFAFRENFALRDIDGTLIKHGDVRLLIAPMQADGTAMPVPQTATDVLTFDGTSYTVVGPDPFKPANESVFFYVHARGV
jgi:hypothetical protein